MTSGSCGIFWDIENCSVVRTSNPTRTAQRLREVALHGEGYRGVSPVPLVLRAFYAFGSVVQCTGKTRDGLQAAGVKFVDIQSQKKNGADLHIITAMFEFALDHPPPARVVLVSGDVDFTPALSALRSRLYDVMVVHGSCVSNTFETALGRKGLYRWADVVIPGDKEGRRSLDGTLLVPDNLSTTPAPSSPVKPPSTPFVFTASALPSTPSRALPPNGSNDLLSNLNHAIDRTKEDGYILEESYVRVHLREILGRTFTQRAWALCLSRAHEVNVRLIGVAPRRKLVVPRYSEQNEEGIDPEHPNLTLYSEADWYAVEKFANMVAEKQLNLYGRFAAVQSFKSMFGSVVGRHSIAALSALIRLALSRGILVAWTPISEEFGRIRAPLSFSGHNIGPVCSNGSNNENNIISQSSNGSNNENNIISQSSNGSNNENNSNITNITSQSNNENNSSTYATPSSKGTVLIVPKQFQPLFDYLAHRPSRSVVLGPNPYLLRQLIPPKMQKGKRWVARFRNDAEKTGLFRTIGDRTIALAVQGALAAPTTMALPKRPPSPSDPTAHPCKRSKTSEQ